MSLTRASEARTESMRDGQLNIDELGREGAAVLITVTGWGDEKDWGQGVVRPVKARIVALTGVHAGEVDEDALIFKAGIRNKLTELGQSVVGRLRPYGARKAIGLEAELDGDVELAERALAKLDGPPASSTPLTDEVKAAKTAARERKVELDDDETPPF